MNKKIVSKYGDFIDRFNRKISLPVAALLAKTGITPNALTLFRSALIFIAMYFYFKADILLIVLAGILLEVGDILDYADGDLARLSGKSSVLGQWLEYLENNFQGTTGSLLGFAICLGIFYKNRDINIFIILFFLCFGFHMKKALIHTPVKSDSWIFNLLNPESFNDFKRSTDSSIIVRIGKVFLWLSTRDVNVVFLASVLLPVFYKFSGFGILYWALIISAVGHNLTWLGLAFYQYRAIKNK